MDSYKKTAEIAELTMQLDHVKALAPDRLAEGLRIVGLEDSELERLTAEMRDLRAKRDGLQTSGLGAEHPDVKQVISDLQGAEARLAGQVERLEEMLEAKRALAEKTLQLTKELEEGERDDSMDERRKIAEYAESSYQYEFQRDLLRELEASYATATERVSLPYTPFVIHEAAETATAPDETATGRSPFRLVSAAVPAEETLPITVAKPFVWGAGAGLLFGLLMAVPLMRVFECVFGPRRLAEEPGRS